MKNYTLISLLMLTLFGVSCSDEAEVKSIDLLSMTLNGSSTEGSLNDIPINSELVIVFDSSLDPSEFTEQVSLIGGSGSSSAVISYANSNSRVNISLSLEYESSYVLTIEEGKIGSKGEVLKEEIILNLSTAQDDVIRSRPPCASASLCAYNLEISGNSGQGNITYYASHPIFEENAEWEDLTQAVVVIHGANRNADDYFNWISNSVAAAGESNNTVVISPFFKNASEASGDDFYWSSHTWRQGSTSIDNSKLSSFEVLDQFLQQLLKEDRFPVLERIVITGHSSGALFTHLFAGYNTLDVDTEGVDFNYVVANSQYFYYPDGRRIDENTEQLITPSNCVSYDLWPLGYNALPDVLIGVSQSTYDNRFVGRDITYLLGNGSQSDPAFNSESCSYVLLGSSRYQRGENMHSYMNLAFGTNHGHTKSIVNGIGHDGNAMYQSTEFQTLISQ